MFESVCEMFENNLFKNKNSNAVVNYLLENVFLIYCIFLVYIFQQQQPSRRNTNRFYLYPL